MPLSHMWCWKGVAVPENTYAEGVDIHVVQRLSSPQKRAWRRGQRYLVVGAIRRHRKVSPGKMEPA